jgi:hypothetical protein
VRDWRVDTQRVGEAQLLARRGGNGLECGDDMSGCDEEDHGVCGGWLDVDRVDKSFSPYFINSPL